MSSKLFISLSTVALLGLSTVAYGNWIWYSKDNSVSKPEGHLPNGDCLELICTNGCVEDANNEYLGGCCPMDGTCRVDGKDVDACCGAGKACKDGKCEESCTGTKLFTKPKSKGQNPDEFQCCADGYNLISGTANVLFKGYLENTNTQKGCCPADRTYNNTCCAEGQLSTKSGCCVSEMVYTDGGDKKCCTTAIYTEDGENKCCPQNSNLPKYDQSCQNDCGCFNESVSGLTCSTETNKCVCPEGYHWDATHNVCEGCQTDKDCGGFGHCDTGAHTCVGCDSNICSKYMTGTSCADNADCGGDGCGYYCHYKGYQVCKGDPKTAMRCTGSTASTCSKPGTCQPIGGILGSMSISGKNLSVSSNTMNWWSAKNWCEARCKTLFDDRKGNPLDCYKPNTTTPITSDTMYSQCCAKGENCNNSSTYSGNQSDKIKRLRDKFGEITLWTRYDHPVDCAGGNLRLNIGSGYTISYGHRNKDFPPTEYRGSDHAMCE